METQVAIIGAGPAAAGGGHCDRPAIEKALAEQYAGLPLEGNNQHPELI
jgi:hypothetical protein